MVKPYLFVLQLLCLTPVWLPKKFLVLSEMDTEIEIEVEIEMGTVMKMPVLMRPTILPYERFWVWCR
ncbi:hypothetical protein LF95_19230 [Thalassospira sp. TSL5-1]|nr:hypothetical protein LF95_19230 [Thalassospira sp. TSL5-1]